MKHIKPIILFIIVLLFLTYGIYYIGIFLSQHDFLHVSNSITFKTVMDYWGFALLYIMIITGILLILNIIYLICYLIVN